MDFHIKSREMTDKSQGLNERKLTCCLVEEVELDPSGRGNVEKGRGQLDACTGRMRKPDNEQLQCLILI